MQYLKRLRELFGFPSYNKRLCGSKSSFVMVQWKMPGVLKGDVLCWEDYQCLEYICSGPRWGFPKVFKLVATVQQESYMITGFLEHYWDFLMFFGVSTELYLNSHYQTKK